VMALLSLSDDDAAETTLAMTRCRYRVILTMTLLRLRWS
jgi:hypothetical protein